MPRRSIDRASAGQSESTSSRSGWSQKSASASKSSQHMTMSRYFAVVGPHFFASHHS